MSQTGGFTFLAPVRLRCAAHPPRGGTRGSGAFAFLSRKDGFTQELLIKSLKHTLIGQDAVGEWSSQLEDTELVRSLVKEGLILDLVLVLSIRGVTLAWL